MSSQEQLRSALLWMAALIAVIMVAGAALRMFRRRLRDSSDPAPPEFSLEELRRLRDRGDLTPQQYERLTAGLADKFRTPRPAVNIHPGRAAADKSMSGDGDCVGLDADGR